MGECEWPSHSFPPWPGGAYVCFWPGLVLVLVLVLVFLLELGLGLALGIMSG